MPLPGISSVCVIPRSVRLQETLNNQAPFADARISLFAIRGQEASQGYLAQKKELSPLGPPKGPEQSPTVESYGGAMSYDRCSPVLGLSDMVDLERN